MPACEEIRPEAFDLPSIERVLASRLPDTSPSETSPRRAAVAMILSPHHGEGIHALFIKRAEHPLDPWSGHMAFPGGHQDPGDKTLEDAARRETFEETGIELGGASLIGRLDDLHGGRLRSHNLSVTPFVFRLDRPAELRLNSEAAAAVWVPLNYLADRAQVRTYYYPPDPLSRPFPSFQYGEYTIWGMTYRMISDFGRLFGVRLPLEGELTDVE